MNVLHDASVKITTPPPVPTTASQAERDDLAGSTMHIRTAPIARRIAVAVAGLTLLVGIALAVILKRGNGAAASAEDAVAEASTEAPPDASDESLFPASQTPAACAMDLSTASANRQWYCKSFMPWKLAVDRKLASLDEARGNGGTQPWVIWLLVLLGATNALTLVIALKRRS